MLTTIRNLTVGLSLFIYPCVANPAPFGLELGKATLEDIGFKCKILGKINTSNGSTRLLIDHHLLGIDGLMKSEFDVDKNNILKGMALEMPKEHFNKMYKILSEKYRLIKKNIPFVGDKYVEFEDEDCFIILESSHMDFKMDTLYLTKSYYKEIKIGAAKREKDKLNREKSLL